MPSASQYITNSKKVNMLAVYSIISIGGHHVEAVAWFLHMKIAY
jgi:hypothetical protein